jgi:cytoskeleton protein RodZ
MPTSVGQQLREARIRQGIELSEVERVIKIRLKYLDAIEADQWEELPGEAYARGFLATYAQFLGLDERPLLEQYRATVAGAAPEPIPETMLPQRGITHGSAIRPALALVPILVIAGIVAVVAISGGSDEGGDEGRHAQGAGGRQHEPSPNEQETTATQPEPSRPSIELRATGAVWVCLVDQNGRPLVNAETLGSGEARGPFQAHGFELTLGNGAIEIDVDGKPIDVPNAAEPLGYRVSESGVEELDQASRPTCT